VSYVKLKHALSAVALDATEHLDRAWVANALLAYAELSRDGPRVAVDALARAGGVPAAEARRTLEATGLFETAGDDGGLSLARPFRAFLPYLTRQSARTVAAVRLLRAPRPRTVPVEIWRAVALFNAGLFFECHEFLEDVWRATPGPERDFYHGLVQAAAGCYHLEKGNVHGARTLLGKAIAKLEPYAPTHGALDLATFLAGLRHVLSCLDGAPLRVDETVLPALDLAGSLAAPGPRARVASTLPPRGPTR
jgi:uncharacterized protein